MAENNRSGWMRLPITPETNEWEPWLDVNLPIDGTEIPDFKEWVNWNGFQLNRTALKGHNGYDFAAYLNVENKVIFGLAPDTKIRAVADGIVTEILNDPALVDGGYGVQITIEHGVEDSGMFSHYLHVKPQIDYGAEVKKGDVIATLYKDPDGDEGRLVHLHLGLVSGWGTRGTSSMGGGLIWRLDNPGLLYTDLYKYNAVPQGAVEFTLKEIPSAQIQNANFKKILYGTVDTYYL